MTVDGSSDNSIEEQIDEDKEERLEDYAIRGSTTSTMGSVTSVANSLCDNLSRESDPVQRCGSFSVPCKVENQFNVSCVQLEIMMACLHIMEPHHQCMNI